MSSVSITSNNNDDKHQDHLRQGSKVTATASAIAGSISGLIARTITAPLDVIKIKLQLQESGTKYQGILQTMRIITKEEGPLALWKGNIPAATMYVIYGGVQFSSYSYYNTKLSQFEESYQIGVKPGLHSFILGSLAGGTSTFVSYPFDLLRTRFVQHSSGFLTVRDTVRDICKAEGIRGLYKGLNTALVSVSVYSGLLFWTYESSRLFINGLDLQPRVLDFVEPLCGSFAGFTAKALVFPLDLIRKRLQVNVHKNRNFIVSGWHIVKKEGVKGLYKGFLASVLKTAPTTGISIWSYEYALRCMEGGVDRF